LITSAISAIFGHRPGAKLQSMSDIEEGESYGFIMDDQNGNDAVCERTHKSEEAPLQQSTTKNQAETQQGTPYYYETLDEYGHFAECKCESTAEKGGNRK
jgi:hypothetical protein